MPDTFPTPRVWVAGERVTAAKMNEISDAFSALYPFTGAGQVAYRDPAGNYLSAIDSPASEDGFFKMQTTGVPAYVSKSQMPGVLHTFGSNYSDSIADSNSTTYVSTGVEVTLTLTKTCTIIAFGLGTASKENAGYIGGVAVEINGSMGYAPATVKTTVGTPISAIAILNGVTAGSRTCKLMYACGNATDVIRMSRGLIVAVAIIEP